MQLAGKRVLVTGGGSGLGADLARGFADAGAQVFISGRRADALARVSQSHSLIKTIIANVSDESSVDAMFETAGRCDIVIANAGVAESVPFTRMTLSQWNEMLSINLTGVFLTLREGLRRMEGWGRLISIASTAGLKGYPYVAHYAASKHGVVGLTRALALEVARKDITVNALCPGFLDTEMTQRSVENIVAKTGRDKDAALAALNASNPQGRLVAPAEVTAAALWLCGPHSRAINGQAIAISGGEI